MPVLQKLSSGFKIWVSRLPSIPKTLRYSLGEKITALFIELAELILVAGYADKEQKATVIRRAGLKLDLLKYFLQTALDLKAADNKTMSDLAPILGEVGRQLGGWQKQARKASPPG